MGGVFAAVGKERYRAQKLIRGRAPNSRRVQLYCYSSGVIASQKTKRAIDSVLPFLTFWMLGLTYYSRQPSIAWPTGDWSKAFWVILLMFVSAFGTLAMIALRFWIHLTVTEEKRD